MINSRYDLPELLNEMHLNNKIIEVGVFQGRFAEHFLQRWNGRKVYMVDAWRHFDRAHMDLLNEKGAKTHLDRLRQTAERVYAYGSRACIIRETSEDAHTLFTNNNIDMVYLDADHTAYVGDEAGIAKDLKVWWPKVRPGGVFAGHDYFDGPHAGADYVVKSKVDTFFEKLDLQVHVLDKGTEDSKPKPSWLVLKPALP